MVTGLEAVIGVPLSDVPRSYLVVVVSAFSQSVVSNRIFTSISLALLESTAVHTSLKLTRPSSERALFTLFASNSIRHLQTGLATLTT